MIVILPYLNVYFKAILLFLNFWTNAEIIKSYSHLSALVIFENVIVVVMWLFLLCMLILLNLHPLWSQQM